MRFNALTHPKEFDKVTKDVRILKKIYHFKPQKRVKYAFLPLLLKGK